MRIKFKSLVYGFKVLTRAKHIGKNFIIEDYSIINKNTFIGDNVRFNGITVEGIGELRIGNYCQLGKNITIITSNHSYDTGTQIPYDENSVCKTVVIEDFVWIGSRVVILPGTKIGEGAIIQGGAVVHGSVPPYAIVGGNPATVFKYRDIDHFKNLKAQNKFIQQ